jgi:hypothetical protein
MRYAKVILGTELLVVTEDGGVVTAHHNEEFMVTTYYKDRVEQIDDEMWEMLADSKQWTKDWKDKDGVDNEMIQDALEWLAPRELHFIETDYHNLVVEFNHEQNKRRAEP